MLRCNRRWLKLLFGLPAAALGLYLWHGQGPYFGLGEAKGEVNRGAAIAAVSLMFALAGVELLFNSR